MITTGTARIAAFVLLRRTLYPAVSQSLCKALQGRSASSLVDRRTRDTESACDYYQQLCDGGIIKHDSKQFKLLRLLTAIEENIYVVQKGRNGVSADESLPAPLPVIRRPKGLYIHGNVGTGKTVVMDMFFERCAVEKKRRVHFHKFMLEIHQRIRAEKQELLNKFGRDIHINLMSERDAIQIVANKVADEASLLCFDEFQVLDICDAMILSKLFSELWRRGTVLIATSNRPPRDLYRDGLNRHYFLPFIDALQRNCLIRDMNSDVDYRITESTPHEKAFYFPVNASTTASLIEDCRMMSVMISALEPNCPLPTVLERPVWVSVPVAMGRTVPVQVFSVPGSVCLVDFEFLCDGDRGAADYQALCQTFRCIYLTGVRQLSSSQHNCARRFILLVDEVYDSKCLLRWTSQCEQINEVFRDGGGNTEGKGDAVARLDSGLEGNHRGFDVKSHFSQVTISQRSLPVKEESLNVTLGELASVVELQFAFQRTISRLTELASEEYFSEWQRRVKKGF
jgi:predicted ATPase